MQCTHRLLVLLLAGCARAEWVHPEKPQEELQKDMAICEERMATVPREPTRKRFTDECLMKRGWRRAS
jgi:hypothetical protein